MRVSYGEAKSRLFSISIGTPQGSVVGALLFRLHVHFPQIVKHLFADDLTLIIKGALEKRLGENVKYVQSQAKTVLKVLESFSDNYLLLVNVAKTKAMFVHNAVVVPNPEIEYKGVPIEYVTNFKCLGVHIGTKFGWEKFRDDRLKKVRQSYGGLRKIFLTIPKNEIKLRRKLFLAFSLPQFIWLFFFVLLFYGETKKKRLNMFLDQV